MLAQIQGFWCYAMPTDYKSSLNIGRLCFVRRSGRTADSWTAQCASVERKDWSASLRVFLPAW